MPCDDDSRTGTRTSDVCGRWHRNCRPAEQSRVVHGALFPAIAGMRVSKQRLLTNGPWSPEYLAGDGLRLRHAIDRVRERRGIAIRESQRQRSHWSQHHVRGQERHGTECGTGRAIQGAPIGIGGDLRCCRRQPHRRAIRVVGEPRREDRVALVREVDAPPRLRACRRVPPQTFVADGRGGAG